jgi:hypothetical protein
MGGSSPAGTVVDVPADLLPRLAIDLVAITVLAYGLYYHRHRRQDLFAIYAMFNARARAWSRTRTGSCFGATSR